MKQQAIYLMVVLGLTIIVGCSHSDTVEVSGVVDWKGAPVPYGDIMFSSLDPHVPAAAGKISDGTYRFRCKPGSKRVEIRSYRLSDKKTPEGNPIGEMYVPARYNSQSELKADVAFDHKNQFDFDLKP